MARPMLRRSVHLLLLVSVLLVPATARAHQPLTRPSQDFHRPSTQTVAAEVASYRMDVRLDPTAKTVTGTGRITYRNPSADTLNEVWLRLYLRAFRDDNTVWMTESGGTHRGYGSGQDSLGDMSVERLALTDGADLLPTTTITDTLMRVPLPRPLEPDQRVEFDVSWTSTLPRVFARTGYGGRDDTFFMVGQWYPKMTVYHDGRWDTEPWHANSEFFHDFGNYDVRITVPAQYVVAATGVPGSEEVNGDTKTIHFTANSVTDFAFAASPDFQTRTASVDATEVVLYYMPEHSGTVAEYMTAATGSLRAFNAWYGAYPHPRLTVVDVPESAGGAGGMEYPTLVTGGELGIPGGGGAALVTAHEIAHQWWPMQTATNEGREPWLDEGITEYSGIRYMAEAGTRLGYGPASTSALTLDRSQYALAPDEPATLPAWQYDWSAYGGAVYGKTALGLWTLENVVGTEQFRRAMADYLRAYRWQHPTGADFRRSLEASIDADINWFFDDFLDGTGMIDYAAGPIEQTGGGAFVTIQREGEVRVPVDVRVTFASGKQETRTWNGQTSSTSYTFPVDDPVIQVEVDPAGKLVAELDVLDNDTAVRPLVGPTITFGGRIAAWAQVVVHLLGLFG